MSKPGWIIPTLLWTMVYIIYGWHVARSAMGRPFDATPFVQNRSNKPKSAPIMRVRDEISSVKAGGSLLVAILLIYIGASQLLQWYSGGGIWVNFKSRGEPNNFQYITYADHPLNFIASLTIDALLVVMGSAIFVVSVREIRKQLR